MGCLDITTKLAMMIDSIQTAKRQLKRDDIRPAAKCRLEEEITILRRDVKELFNELFKIISN